MKEQENPFADFFDTYGKVVAQAFLTATNLDHSNPDVRSSHQSKISQASYISNILRLSEDVLHLRATANNINEWCKTKETYNTVHINVRVLSIYMTGDLEPRLHRLLTELLCEYLQIQLPPELQPLIFKDWIVADTE